MNAKLRPWSSILVIALAALALGIFFVIVGWLTLGGLWLWPALVPVLVVILAIIALRHAHRL